MGGQRRTGTCTDGIFAREINETMPFAATWMDLEIIIRSEGSKKEKDKYHMRTLTCGI